MSVTDILDRLKTAPVYHPASVEVFDDVTLQAGDVVKVKSTLKDVTTTYNVPIYSQHIVWNGSGMTTLEATGNEKREALPPLRRAQSNESYRTRRYARATQTQLEEDEQHYTTEFTKTNKEIGLSAKITGVKLDANGNVVWQQAKDAQGRPLYYDSNGNITTEVTDNPVWSDIPEWDNSQGATVWGDMGTSGFMSHMFNAIKDNKGNTISIGGVQTSPGAVLIEAMNSKGTGEAKINANIVSIQSTTGSGISIDANGNVSIVAKGVADKINSSDTTGDGAVIINANHLDVSGLISAGSIVVENDIFTTVGEAKALTASYASLGNLSVKTLNVETRSDNYEQFSSHFVKMTGITATNAFLGMGDLDLAHTHSFSVSASGEVTMGGAVPVGDDSANFNIADTAFYKNGVAAVHLESLSHYSATWSKKTPSGTTVQIPTITATPSYLLSNTQTASTNKSFDIPWYTTAELSYTKNQYTTNPTISVVAKSGTTSTPDTEVASQSYSLTQGLGVVNTTLGKRVQMSLYNGTDCISYAQFTLSHSYATVEPASASVTNKVTGTVKTLFGANNTEWLSTTHDVGYVGAGPSTNGTGSMKVTSYLSSAASGGSIYGKAETVINLSGDATINPGGSTTVKAKVGDDAYASFTVTARSGGTLSELTVPDDPNTGHPISYNATSSPKTISFYPKYKMSGSSDYAWWDKITINDPGLWAAGRTAGINEAAGMLGPKTITSNATYTAGNDGLFGYSYVVVKVPTSGGQVSSVNLYSDDWKLQEETVTVYINGSQWGNVKITAWPDT